MKDIRPGTPGPLACVALALFFLSAPAPAVEHRLGLGVHYWRTIEELADDPRIDEDGMAGVLSYQLAPVGIFKLQIDVEYFPQGFLGSAEEAWSPQGYLVLGRRWYIAAGAGWIYSESIEGELSDIFYAARLGADFLILPRTRLDINANYRAPSWEELDEADTDTITLGAVLRVRL